MTRERFYNSATQPVAADCLVDADYTPGDGVLIVNGLPTYIGLDGFSAGDVYRVGVGNTRYKVSALGAGNVHWSVTVAEGSTDAVHLVGTEVFLVLTSGAIKDGIRDIDAVTVTDQTAQGWPNSETLQTALGARSLADLGTRAYSALTGVPPTDGATGTGSLRTLGTGATQAAAGNDSRLADPRTPTSHDHTSTAGDGGVLTNDEHDGYSEMAAISTPSTPSGGKARYYAKTVSGVTGIYAKGDDGVEVGPLGTGSGGGGGVTGHYEIIVSGSGPPPDFLTTPDGKDYLYGLVP